MDPLALMCFFLGAVSIAARAPLIVWPEVVLAIFRRIIEREFRLRVMGLVFSIAGAFVVFLTYNDPRIWAHVIFWLGVLWSSISIILLVILPKTYRAIAIFYMEMDSSVHRATGILGVLFGAFMIWLGFYLA